MTAPLDLDTLEVLVGPAAWAYHDNLPDEAQVDVERVYRVRGDVRLVAADVLTAAAIAARRAAVEAQAGALKAFRVEGDYSEEYFAPTSAESGDAAAWEAEATRLRAEVRTAPQAQRSRSVVYRPEVDG